MQQYLLSVYQPDGLVIEPAVLEEFSRNLDALSQEMKAAGAWVFTGGLQPPSTATVVQLQDGDVLTTDGPLEESKWCLAGFVIVRAVDMDSALEWGRKLATLAKVTKLPVEVRPFQNEAEH